MSVDLIVINGLIILFGIIGLLFVWLQKRRDRAEMNKAWELYYDSCRRLEERVNERRRERE